MTPDNPAIPYAPTITLRDYFAAQIVSGMLAAGNCSGADTMTMAMTAYRIADAMLLVRTPPGEQE